MHHRALLPILLLMAILQISSAMKISLKGTDDSNAGGGFSKYLNSLLDMLYPVPDVSELPTGKLANVAQSSPLPNSASLPAETMLPHDSPGATSDPKTTQGAAEQARLQHGRDSTKLIPQVHQLLAKAEAAQKLGDKAGAESLQQQASETLQIAVDNILASMNAHVDPKDMVEVAQKSAEWWKQQTKGLKGDDAENANSTLKVLKLMEKMYQRASASNSSPSTSLVGMADKAKEERSILEHIHDLRERLIKMKKDRIPDGKESSSGKSQSAEATVPAIFGTAEAKDIQAVENVVQTYEKDHAKYTQIKPVAEVENKQEKKSVMEDIDSSPDIPTAEERIMRQIN